MVIISLFMVAVTVAVLPAPVGAQVAAPVRTSVVAFTHVAVIPMDSERVLTDQTVLVQGDRIAALGPARQVTVPAGATEIDGRGKFLIPGLGDMHVHVCLPCNVSASPSTIAVDLLPYLANGITTVRDMHSGGPASPLLAVRRAIASGQMLGPRIYTAGDPDSNPWPGPATGKDAAINTAALKPAGHDFVKLYGWTGEVYDSAVAAAHRVGLPIVGHVPEDRPFENVLKDHWRSIEHLTGYLPYAMGLGGRWSMAGIYMMDHQSFIDTAAWMRSSYTFPSVEIRALAEATRRYEVWNCPTLLNDLGTLNDPEADQAQLRVLTRIQEFRLQVVKALHDAGAGLLLGSDAAVEGPLSADAIPGFSIHLELQQFVQAGLTPYQALATGTRNVAEFLGTADSTGTVAVGKRADLVLLKGNPLQDVRATVGPVGVMVGGAWLPRKVFDDAKARVLSQFAEKYPEAALRQLYPELVKPTSP